MRFAEGDDCRRRGQRAGDDRGARGGGRRPELKGAPGRPCAEPETPEDLWSPAQEPAPGGEFVEEYGLMSPVPELDGTSCLQWDDSLWSHADHFRYRWNMFKSIRHAIDANEGGMDQFTQGYKYYGLNRGEHEGQTGIWYREWAAGRQGHRPRRESSTTGSPGPSIGRSRTSLACSSCSCRTTRTELRPSRTRSKIKLRLETDSGRDCREDSGVGQVGHPGVERNPVQRSLLGATREG